MHTQIRLLIGKEESGGGLSGPEHFSQEPHYIHDQMLDASPGQVQTISMILYWKMMCPSSQTLKNYLKSKIKRRIR
jgi:hypothetical protein